MNVKLQGAKAWYPRASRLVHQVTLRNPGLAQLSQLGKDGVVDRPDSVILIQKHPPHHAPSVDNEQGWLGDFPFRIVEVIGVDYFVVDIGEERKREIEFVGQLAILFRTVYADGYDFRPFFLELLVIRGQTGQLLPAVWSPVASVEHEHDL